MKLQTYTIKGKIDSTLKLDVGKLEPEITQGKWELCLSSVGFSYTTNVSDHLIAVSTNYVIGKKLNNEKEIVMTPATLAIVFCGGSPGKKRVMSINKEDFFEINNAQYTLEVNAVDAMSGEPITGVDVVVLLYLRRIG